MLNDIHLCTNIPIKQYIKTSILFHYICTSLYLLQYIIYKVLRKCFELIKEKVMRISNWCLKAVEILDFVWGGYNRCKWLPYVLLIKGITEFTIRLVIVIDDDY